MTTAAHENGTTTPVPARLVGDVMTSAVVCAHEDAVFKEIADALTRNKIPVVPVIDGERCVVGVITGSDLLARVAQTGAVVPRGHRLSVRGDVRRKAHASIARDLMTAPAISTTPQTSIRDAARKAAHYRVRYLPVVDDDGILVGIVTNTDLIKVFLRDDADIQRDIERGVAADGMLLDPLGIRVEVCEGVVTLTGQLESRLVARQFADQVAQIPGVIDVEDKLTYLTKDIPSPRVWPPY